MGAPNAGGLSGGYWREDHAPAARLSLWRGHLLHCGAAGGRDFGEPPPALRASLAM